MAKAKQKQKATEPRDVKRFTIKTRKGGSRTVEAPTDKAPESEAKGVEND